MEARLKAELARIREVEAATAAKQRAREKALRQSENERRQRERAAQKKRLGEEKSKLQQTLLETRRRRRDQQLNESAILSQQDEQVAQMAAAHAGQRYCQHTSPSKRDLTAAVFTPATPDPTTVSAMMASGRTGSPRRNQRVVLPSTPPNNSSSNRSRGISAQQQQGTRSAPPHRRRGMPSIALSSPVKPNYMSPRGATLKAGTNVHWSQVTPRERPRRPIEQRPHTYEEHSWLESQIRHSYTTLTADEQIKRDPRFWSKQDPNNYKPPVMKQYHSERRGVTTRSSFTKKPCPVCKITRLEYSNLLNVTSSKPLIYGRSRMNRSERHEEVMTINNEAPKATAAEKARIMVTPDMIEPSLI